MSHKIKISYTNIRVKIVEGSFFKPGGSICAKVGGNRIAEKS